MDFIEVDDLGFSYDKNEYVFKNISFKANRGDFVLFHGLNGSGKTTLFKLFNRALRPQGQMSGKISFDKEDPVISYVGQDPSRQAVTDKVINELAFGMENLAFPQDLMASRIAEVTSFFSLEKLLWKDLVSLSLGELVMVNLASAICLSPDLLLLDEVDDKLDPINRDRLIEILRKLNKDLGISVFICGHNLKAFLPLADKMYFMESKKGLVEISDFNNLLEKRRILQEFDPEIQIYLEDKLASGGYIDFKDLPIDIKRARAYIKNLPKKALDKYFKKEKENLHINDKVGKKESGKKVDVRKEEPLIRLKSIDFSYEKNQRVLKDLNLEAFAGEIVGLMGNNASGKTSLLKVVSGLERANSGQVYIRGKNIRKYREDDLYQTINFLGQEAEDVFSRRTVIEELAELKKYRKESLDMLIRDFDLGKILEKNPFDLSYGQKQRLGLAKIIFLDRDIMLLDEPTRGLERSFIDFFGNYLNEIKEKKTILLVSHDIDFLYKYTDKIGFLFDGKLVNYGSSREILDKNYIFTSHKNKIFRGLDKYEK